MGKLNFCGYLISRFYPTREIRKKLMHAKNMCFMVSNGSRYLLKYHCARVKLDQQNSAMLGLGLDFNALLSLAVNTSVNTTGSAAGLRSGR